LRGGRSTGAGLRILTRGVFTLSGDGAQLDSSPCGVAGGAGTRGEPSSCSMKTVCSSSSCRGAEAGERLKKDWRAGDGAGGSSSRGAGMVGARSWAGAVVAHSRSGVGGGGIRSPAADSLMPQFLQKFAPSRFSVLQTGQIEAMACLLTTSCFSAS